MDCLLTNDMTPLPVHNLKYPSNKYHTFYKILWHELDLNMYKLFSESKMLYKWDRINLNFDMKRFQCIFFCYRGYVIKQYVNS